MKDVLDDVVQWLEDGRNVALARVVEVAGSGPRGPGAAMATNDLGEVTGSVSGGCVESAVAQACQELLEESASPRLLTFGYSDDTALEVGLTCGGTIKIFIEPLHRWHADLPHRLHDALHADAPAVLASVVDGDAMRAPLLLQPGRPNFGTFGDPILDDVVARDAFGELEAGRSRTRHYGRRGESRANVLAVFFHTFAPPPRMLIFGAVDFTGALANMAKVMGYHVTVCDARRSFATTRRFPMADDVVVKWPHRLMADVGTKLGPQDAVCVLTHDPKFDVPAITAALRTDVGYVGAMGSRRTHADRLVRLQAAGLRPREIDRLMSPIGVDLGGTTPEETALSILAEIVARRMGKKKLISLRDTEGRLHPH